MTLNTKGTLLRATGPCVAMVNTNAQHETEWIRGKKMHSVAHEIEMEVYKNSIPISFILFLSLFF